MKIFNLLFVSTVSMLIASSSFAAKSTDLWECQGNNIEGFGIAQETDGVYPVDLAWDCWPGGGICEVHTKSKLTSRETGAPEILFTGTNFSLQISTEPLRDGTYRGHVTAAYTGQEDEAGTISINENVRCRK
jgi:hypothetical protein